MESFQSEGRVVCELQCLDQVSKKMRHRLNLDMYAPRCYLNIFEMKFRLLQLERGHLSPVLLVRASG